MVIPNRPTNLPMLMTVLIAFNLVEVFVRQGAGCSRENDIKSFSKVPTRRQCISLGFGGKRGTPAVHLLYSYREGCACPVASVAVVWTYGRIAGVVVAFEYLTWRCR